jgi:ATP-dependent Clp protease ATP-binding subunit ClpA
MLPFTPRLRIALATAEAVATDQKRRDVTCSDILAGIASLVGGVADSLLKARGFSSPNVPAVTMEQLNHETRAYASESLFALSVAMQDAANRSRQLIGVEDMLVGILSAPCAEISALLAERNINPQELLSEVRRQL